MKTLETVSDAEILAIASDLEACVPSELGVGQAGALGGIVTKVLKLVEDLKNKAWMAVVADVRDILNEILGDTGSSISFAQQAAAIKFDWGKLVTAILKLLPLILGTEA